MSHVKTILIKFLIFSIIILFVFLFYGFPFRSLLLLAASLAIVTYVLGDVFILPLTGNRVATIADGAVALLGVLLWTMPSFGLQISLFAGAVFVAIIIAVCEWFLHIYVIGRMWRDDHEPNYE